MKKVLKVLLVLVLAVLIAAAGYVGYVLLSWHRIGNQDLSVNGSAALESGTPQHIISYNIGFGAYESDYGFFMDGGTESWAWSKERLDANLKTIASFLGEQDADLYLVQEVDFDSTRSYHFDERPYLTAALPGYAWTFAQNFDSPFLCYPFRQPHGASRAGLMTFSSLPVQSASRVELPIESGFSKFLDLDRCYSKNRISLEGGGELVLYNFHLSAYSSDGSIATRQLELLLEDMEQEYLAGSFCIAGGDFNKDILGDSSVYFGAPDNEYSWAQPIPEGTFDNLHIRLVAPLDEADPVPSCRNADSAYHPGQYVLTIDGFLVSENVEVLDSSVLDTGFAWSDHNPVEMTFLLH